mmetsp:Transcript_27785/g.70280  ORF Transcript_27785/g.70280 Transcript_27785/m.70280 type:complete len:305 (+) Transcript_27785:1735-2649(+)
MGLVLDQPLPLAQRPGYDRRGLAHCRGAVALDDAQHGELALPNEDHVVHHLSLPHGYLVPAEAALGQAVGHGRDVLSGDHAALERLLYARELPKELHTLLDELPVQLPSTRVVVAAPCDQQLRRLVDHDGCGAERLLGLHRQLAEAHALPEEGDRLRRSLRAAALGGPVLAAGAGGLRGDLDPHTTGEDDVELVALLADTEDLVALFENLQGHLVAEAGELLLPQLAQQGHVPDELDHVLDAARGPVSGRLRAGLPDGLELCHRRRPGRPPVRRGRAWPGRYARPGGAPATQRGPWRQLGASMA